MKKIIYSALLCILVLTGCESSQTEVEQNDNLTITTTYYPLALITSEIGGDLVTVNSIYPEDSDPHSYELTPKQTIDIANSNLVIALDEHTEQNIINSAGDAQVLVIGDQLEQNTDSIDDEHGHDESTSHLWITPHGGMLIGELVSQKLIEIDPENKLTYEDNYNNFKSKLEVQDKEYEQFAQNQTKPFIVAHDAYQMYEHDYSIEYISLYGEHHDDEPTSNEVKQVIDTINDLEIKTIFAEQNDLNNKVLKSISEQTNTTIDVFYNLESASSSQDFDTIDQLYDYNLNQLKKGQE